MPDLPTRGRYESRSAPLTLPACVALCHKWLRAPGGKPSPTRGEGINFAAALGLAGPAPALLGVAVGVGAVNAHPFGAGRAAGGAEHARGLLNVRMALDRGDRRERA